jgi:glutamine amidotransferase-like uncharacterized protein
MIIRVYTGSGTSRNGAPLLVEELSKHLDADVSGIDEHEMRGSENWKKETSTIMFAGQTVRGFKKALGDNVLNDIQNLVHEGAFNYIGICAGAAFASASIKYRVKEAPTWEEKKIQNSGLSFFNGLATGPCRSVSGLPFSGQSENLHLITVLSLNNSKSYNAFHWGGPALIPQGRMEEASILSCLKSDGTPLAYRLKAGQGTVTLYSFHPEINANNVGRWADVQHLPKDIRATEMRRIEQMASQMDGTVFTHFLEETGLKTDSSVATPSPYVFPI